MTLKLHNASFEASDGALGTIRESDESIRARHTHLDSKNEVYVMMLKSACNKRAAEEETDSRTIFEQESVK